MDGFRVDLPDLARAAGQVRNTVGAASQVPGDVPTTGLGHAALADAVAGFGARWADGVTNLNEDAREIAARLVRCAEDYERADGAVGRTAAEAHDLR